MAAAAAVLIDTTLPCGKHRFSQRLAFEGHSSRSTSKGLAALHSFGMLDGVRALVDRDLGRGRVGLLEPTLNRLQRVRERSVDLAAKM